MLPEGLYEALVSLELREAIRATPLISKFGDPDEGDSADWFARHVAVEVARVLESLKGDERVARQAELVNDVIRLLKQKAPKAMEEDSALELPVQILRALHRANVPEPPRTTTPLAMTTLLTGAHNEPRLGAEIEQEIRSADRIDALVSFVTWEGWRRLQPALEEFAKTGKLMRLMTTTYTGATDAEAVEAIAKLPNVKVRVSYDARRTRLHAKAWLFHRETGFGTAYVGSANLSRAALSGGLEWTVKIAEADLPYVLEKFRGTFDTLWEDNEFEKYDPNDPVSRERLVACLANERGGSSPDAAKYIFYTLQPFPYQQAILDRLTAERTIHHRFRNLVVAATGTGKTLVAAFDYHRQIGVDQIRPKLLFVAHREELLTQARDAFRHVLHDESFGELLAGGKEPKSFDHLFATIQSITSCDLLKTFPADHWKFVVIDECHHAPADTFSDFATRIRPEILLGLTATPERADGKDILHWFDGKLAAEMRLWHALDKQILAPFEYHGLADGVALDQVKWTRGSYDAGELSRVYTGNDRRAELVISQFARLRRNLLEARALGFCVSVEHAEFMARKFNEAKIPALAVHGGTSDAIRKEAPALLRERKVNVLFTCDLYNEGVDLPSVDTLLLLRPTSSSTVFLQQLGRGLRLHPGKLCCLVLDFIGQSRKEFRFDRVLTALTGVPRGRLHAAVEHEFPTLPSGCHLRLDRVSRDIILENLRTALRGGRVRLATELGEIRQQRGRVPTLAEFLEDAGRELDDVYEIGGWTRLKRSAGLVTTPEPAGEDELNRRLRFLTHVDDPQLLGLYKKAIDGLNVAALAMPDARRLLMLGYQLYREQAKKFKPADVPPLFARFPELRGEFRELIEVLSERVSLVAPLVAGLDWPLALHRTYARREILAAAGRWTEQAKPESREGYVRLDDQNTDIFFVTLDKTTKRFSPTTQYHDYAISPTLFHWQSQSTTSDTSPTGLRYIEQAKNGARFLLFVRATQDDQYRFLGPLTYFEHKGSRPISITWRLQTPIPASLFQDYATLLSA